jgi:predicted DsbA family dithiol-disulfide isomerase
MPFELRPEPHPTLKPDGDYLQQAWQRSVYPLARHMGVEINMPQVSPQPHTHLAFEGYEVGLIEMEFEAVLRSRKYREAHRQALRHAYDEAGVTGVPLFVIGDQVLTGLQDKETLVAVIEEELTGRGGSAST